MIRTGRHQEETPRSTYPLTALQQGMLFHYLLEPNSGVDIEQLVISLPEAIDADLLQRSWEIVSGRHDVLRSSFRWHEADRPEQDVWDTVAVPFRHEDWRALAPGEREARLTTFLRHDRRDGFAMDRAPLLRVALFRVAEAAYQLVWTFHHAILDGRSFTVVLRDVFACYEALERGTEPAFGPAAPPFRDHVAFVAASDLPAAESYWRERLRGRGAPTPLPTAFPDSVPGERHRERHVALSAATTSALEQFARDNDLTVNTLVQGAWALVLARHCGEPDVIFGATRACRRSTIVGADEVAGLFINTLPVRVYVDPDRLLVAWLRDLRADWTSMRRWENSPLPQVQRWSEMPTGTSLFESIVVFENRLLESSLRALGGRWRQRAVRLYEQTNFPLTLAVYGDTELSMRLGYDARRFDDASITRILGHLATMLDGFACGDADRTLGDVPWLTQAERRQVVEEWNATATPYPRDASVGALFSARAATKPDAIAVVQGDRALSYRELDERANQLARRLQHLGVGLHAPVGLCLPRSLDTVVGALGILKAGGAYVALDPAYPRERLAFLIEDTGLQVVVTAERFASPLPAGPYILRLDTERVAIAAESTQSPPGEVSADGAAYIIYTSGSTGIPKGVVIPHRAIVRLVVDTNYARFGPDEVGLAFAPLTFDASTFEMWGPLLNGGRLALFGTETPTFEDLSETIRSEGVTTLWLTAALFHQMVDRDIEGLRPLRQLLAGGDVLSVPHVTRVLRDVPGCRMINGYGPTENTTFTACFDVPRDWNADGRAASVPIGRPIANTTAYVLDERMMPVPIGVTGRLFAGGDGVALGYHARPELTAERFVRDPFSPHPGAQMYDTGDRVSWRPDGTLDFFGRADQQLKIRGFRVEPGEVEATLMQHPDVLDAVVVGRNDAGGAKRLIGYVVPRTGERLEGEALAAFLASRLPAYMVPSAVLSLAAFPVTANGKVDRAQLPDPDVASAARKTTYVAPRDATEATLVRIWTDVLGIERIGINDNFFELGGDSILTIALISRAREAGLRVTPRQLYDAPTVAELARVAVPLAGSPRESGLVAGSAPLTPVQRWFFETETEELNYWNQTFLFSARTALDTAALATALRDLIAHHDALRLRYDRDGATWRQRFAAPDAEVPIDTIDLSAVPDTALNGALEEACVRAQRSLDIECGPLLRALHVRLGERGERLLLAVHHLAVDGVSWRLLLEDLETAYDAARQHRAASLPAKTTSFKEWAHGLLAHADAGAFDDQRDYWRALVTAPSLAVPRDRTAGPRDDVEGDAETLTVALSAGETLALLQQVPAAYNTRINDVLVTALARTLRRWAGTGSLLVDLEGHGREDIVDGVDLSRTVGWFTTIFPVRLALCDAPPVDQLRSIKEQLLAIPQRGLGYGALHYLLRDAVLREAPPAEIVLNYLGQFDRSVADSTLFAFAREPYGPWRGPRARRAHPVEINALVLDGRLELRWTFGRGIHTVETIARVAGDFTNALRELIAECTAPNAGGYTPSDFPLARLDQATLDAATGTSRNVEDIYPLAAIQTLFHVFADPGDDPGFEQWRYRMRGPIDRAALRRAWQTVVDRHPILRTAFVSDGLAEPLQLVRRHAELPWTEHDLRGLPAQDRERTIDRLLREDRERGFDFQRAPLMRLTLVRIDDDTIDLVWSQHHLLVDRWSWPIVLREVGLLYDGLLRAQTPALEPAVPYRAYIDWLGRQRLDDAEAFWGDLLAGYVPPFPFARRPSGDGRAEQADEIRIDLTAAQTAALHRFTRDHQLPVNAAISGVWALWLGHYTGTSDVLIGLALSGRPTDLPGVDRMVGVMINNLPVRAYIRADDEIVGWLRALQAQTIDVQQFAYTPLRLVQEWSGVPWHRRLFENLIVFQHAAADEATSAWLGEEIRIERLHAPTRTSYPISLVVTGGDVLSLRMTYDPRLFAADTIEGVLERLRELLVAISDGAGQHVGSLLAMLPAAERGTGVEQPRKRSLPAGAVHVEPRSATEAAIAGIWSELLDIEDIGVTENFLALGGHSLLAMQVVSRIRDTFRLEVPVRAIFRNPTVEKLSLAVIALERKPGQVERIAELVRRVAAMSLEELRLAAAANAATQTEKGRTDAE